MVVITTEGQTMAETKADLIKKAKELGIEHMTTANTMAELRESIAAVEPKKHDKEALPTEEHEAKVAKAGKRSAKGIAETEEKLKKEERKETGEESAHTKQAAKPAKSRLERAGKKLREASKLINKDTAYTLKDAVELAIKTNIAKFDATVEVHVNLNVDPRQADQNLRDTLVMPNGTGKTVRVAVLADVDEAKEAKAAGADIAGHEELLKEIEKGILNFDILVATPALMPKLGKFARTLGPKGLMPNPKSGTVTTDVKKAVSEAKAGRVEYRVDSSGIVHVGAGKVSFGATKLEQNIQALFSSIKGNKPSSIKGVFVKNITITTTMGPGIRVAVNEL